MERLEIAVLEVDLSDHNHLNRVETTFVTTPPTIFAAGVAEAEEHPEIGNTRTRNKMIQNFAMVLDFSTRGKNKVCRNNKRSISPAFP